MALSACAKRMPYLRCYQYAYYHSTKRIYGYDPSSASSKSASLPRIDSNAHRLVEAYRAFGYRKADLDPLRRNNGPKAVPELDPSNYGLDAGASYNVGASPSSALSLAEVTQRLDSIYCGPIAAEFMHLETIKERDWFAEKFETLKSTYSITDDDRRAYARIMLECQNFDHFLATKFGSVKRYGGEGAESMMPYFYDSLRHGCKSGVQEIIACMPHRGRLNLLTTLLNYPAVIMFRKKSDVPFHPAVLMMRAGHSGSLRMPIHEHVMKRMRGKPEFPADVKGLGDVLSHLTTSVDIEFEDGKIHFTMIPNPSHLEANNPVAVGKARGRQQSLGLGDYGEGGSGGSVLCLQVHGDASFTGQGVVAETLALSQAPHFTVSGSVHLIVNNQIGFTTEPCSLYCSDIGKATGCPIVHVNGDHPEEVARSARLALDYRNTFHKDVIVDLICFRRWGHNELDDPSFTQPVMYDIIEKRPSIPDAYATKLQERGLVSNEERQKWISEHTAKLNDQLQNVDSSPPVANHLSGRFWSGYVQAPSSVELWDTGIDTDLLKYIGAKSVEIPPDFTLHGHLKKSHCEARLKKITEGRNLDWATAEALAIGSLLYQGISVRLCGQDVARGTFSHRHVMLVDRTNDTTFIPLNRMVPNQKAFLEVANSILSEEAVLGFEYGMAIENPGRLVVWEAQFGDFFNAAQVVIDTYVSSGESKWLLQNGLVMLLPHGIDGAGPEHSSCRIERFLQLTDSKEDGVDGEDVNMHVVNPTTSGQYFHLLRRQMVRNYRKPLVVASPKILLRMQAASSGLEEMAPGSAFQPVLADSGLANPSNIRKIVFCSGKHYYALEKHRRDSKLEDVAIVRLEALCPFPAAQLQQELRKYVNAISFVWSQEEPRNAGAWSFVRPRIQNLVGCNLRYAGRPELPIVAVAIAEIHQKEHAKVIQDTFS